MAILPHRWSIRETCVLSGLMLRSRAGVIVTQPVPNSDAGSAGDHSATTF